MPMKFWRSSSGSDDGGALAAAGRALALEAVVSLLHGREVTAESWRPVAERYHALSAASRGKPLVPEADATGILADVICEPDAERARGLAARLPTADELDLYTLTAEAIVWDRVTRSAPGLPQPHSRLAHGLYALLPKYYQAHPHYLAGTLRIIAEHLAFFTCGGEVRGAFVDAAALTAATSQLASKYGVYRLADAVIDVGARVIAANRGVTGRDALGLCMVANNLANLHIALADDQPSARLRHFGNALACAEAGAAAVEAATGPDVPKVREATLRKVAQLRPAVEALRASASDPDADDYNGRAAGFELQSSLAMKRIGDAPQAMAARIAAAGDAPGSRARAAGEVLAAQYAALTDELYRVVTSGCDWSLCKLLLALGAIASGRLGGLTEDVVRSWLMKAAAPQDSAPWTAFRARQYMPAGESKDVRAAAAGRIVALAMLADLIAEQAPDVPFGEMLRSHNAALLKFIVESRPVHQECAGPALSRDADADAVQRPARRIFRPRIDPASLPADEQPTG
jgi:hypothetical protein